MNFYLIHPDIINLYVNLLTLHFLQEQLTEEGPTGLTQEIQGKVDEAASEYVLLVKKAEKMLGSSELVQSQLNILSMQRHGDA